mmetsp:Transcript_10356/g.31848  ORF Transcript_10356/g.31848 Transcript_10356/m.31848 type:complete len:309 (+) Transcript_10356:1230-2156(+)
MRAWSLLDFESMGAVLEDARHVGGVNIELEWEGSAHTLAPAETNEIAFRVRWQPSVVAIEQAIDRIGVVLVLREAEPAVVVGGRDVVPQSQDACRLVLAQVIEDMRWDDPVKEWLSDLGVRHSSVIEWVPGVAQMVVPGEGRHQTFRRPPGPLAVLYPLAPASTLAVDKLIGSDLAVELELLADPGDVKVRPVAAHAVVAHVLRVPQIIVAPARVIGEDGNVAPRRGMPVRVIIALLSALKAATCATRILPRVDGNISGKFLVSNVETLVARAHGAVLIVLKWLMKAVFGIVRSSLRHGHPLRGAPVA